MQIEVKCIKNSGLGRIKYSTLRLCIYYRILSVSDLPDEERKKKKPGHSLASLLIKIFCYLKLHIPLIVI